MSGSVVLIYYQKYDRSVTTFSNDGRLFQVEYAQKAVDNSESILGIKCKDGIIVAAEKLMTSKLLTKQTNRRIYAIDDHLGLVINGRLPDGRNIIKRARSEAEEYLKYFAIQIEGQVLNDRISQYMHAHTLYGSYRPFGSSIIQASHDQNGYNLHLTDPSGHNYGYHACASGRGKTIIKNEFEKKNFANLTCRQAVVSVAKMLNLCHEEFKEKTFEYEIFWICDETNKTFQRIPQELQNQSEKLAIEEIEREAMGE